MKRFLLLCHRSISSANISGLRCFRPVENLWFLHFTHRFGDLFGARVALTLACASTIVFFLLLAIADHPAMLFIHKLPTIFMHVVPGKQHPSAIPITRLSILNLKSRLLLIIDTVYLKSLRTTYFYCKIAANQFK